MKREDLPKDPREARKLFREGVWTQPTTGIWIDYVNANLMTVPQSLAWDFLLFCQRNPQACPVLEVLDVGDPIVKRLAPGADLRTDLPRYRVFEHGECVAEPTDVRDRWRADLVPFLFGCSATFERALEHAGIRPSWRLDGRRTPIYVSKIQCEPAGKMRGPMAVTMRPIPAQQVALAVQVTARFPRHHGAPIHVGDPAAIGIDDITKPGWGGPVEVKPGEVPVWWACGVTPQLVALEIKPDLVLTQMPGHMFICDGLAAKEGIT
jgi:uncharacterized protein YcsI (UPF0317 family)